MLNLGHMAVCLVVITFVTNAITLCGIAEQEWSTEML